MLLPNFHTHGWIGYMYILKLNVNYMLLYSVVSVLLNQALLFYC